MSDPRKRLEKFKEKEIKEGKEFKELKEKELKEIKEKEIKEGKEKESKESIKDIKEKEIKEAKEFKEQKEKEVKEFKELKESKEFKDHKEFEGPFDIDPLRQEATLSGAAAAPEDLATKILEKIKPEKEFEKVKREKEALEKIKPEKEFKELEKIKPEKELEKVKPEKEKGEKEIFEGPGDLTIEERLDRIESAVSQIAHFIQADLRPDLSQGALKSEPDAGQKDAGAKKEPGSGKKRS